MTYIRYLAEQVGYVFYIDPGPVPGMNKAYWGPQMKVGRPQPALNSDMDAYTNVESLHFTFDQEKNQIPLVYIYISGDRHEHSDSDSADHAAESAAGSDSAVSDEPDSARPQAVPRRSGEDADSAGAS